MKILPLHNSALQREAPAHLNAVRDSIIRTLVYFDIFHYPLTPTEIRQFLGVKAPEPVLHEALTELLKEKKIFLEQGLFSLQDNPLLAARRMEGNRRADMQLKKAHKIGRFLYRFPYVQAIGISGSLSKNFAEEKSDIDFFIITRSNRLWVARTLLHIYKKFTFLTGRQHDHCMNYFLDETVMTLPERNIFNAIEIKTLVPVCGETVFQQFHEQNDWTADWLPACRNKVQEKKNPKGLWLKSFIEWVFNSKAGNKMDDFLMRLTQNRWARKQQKGKKNIRGLAMGLFSDKHIAMSNPGNFREQVLAEYTKRLGAQKFNSLSQERTAHPA